MTGRPTILYVQPTSEIGGSDVALYRLVAELDARRFRAVVAVPRDGPLVERLRAAGVRTVIVPMLQLRPRISAAYQARFAFRLIPTIVALVRLIRSEQASIVHTNALYSPYGPIAALLARVPHVWHIREIPQLHPLLMALIRHAVVRLSARVIPMTEGVARALRLPRSPRSSPIPDGIDLRRFNPDRSGARIRGELGIPDAAPLVGMVARLDPWKGIDVFIRACAEIADRRPDAHFIVCGGELPGYEAYAAGLRRLAAELSLNGRMHFTGWTYRLEEIGEVMAALDILVHTPVAPEPFGLVLVEAMATGRPVVASACGGIPEVVEDGSTGTLVPRGDPGATARAALELIDDPAKARAFGAAGRARAERLFDVTAYADRIEALYAEILLGRTLPR